MRQCQCFQSLDVANGVSEQHSAARPRIQHHRLAVLSDTVERLGEGDVGTGCQCAIVSGIKGRVGRSDDCIVGNVDGVGAAGSHQTSAEGAAARGIGFKVCWSADAANRTAINRCPTVIHFQAAGGVQRLAKVDALAREGGDAAGCTANSHGTIVGLGEVARVDAAAIDRGGSMNRQVAQGIHGPTQCDHTCGDVGVATENDGAHQAESASACEITVHGGGACAQDAPSVALCTRCDRACQRQKACATVHSGVRQQADGAANPTQDHGLICCAQSTC